MATIVNARDVLLQASTRLISDNILSIEEKPSWITAYANILSEQTSVGAEATKWSLTAQKTTYDNTITALTTYLGTLTTPVAWNNLTNITVLSSGSNGGVTFRQKFTDVATAKAAIYAGVTAVPTTKSIVVTASSQLFQISKAGVNSPASVTFTAQRENLPINPTWSVTSGTGTLTSVSGDSATITFANMTSDTVTVRVLDSGSGLSDSITVVKVREGVDAVVGYLTNEAHTLPASSAGVVSSYTGAGGTFKVYYGAADVTTSCTFSVLTNASAVTTSIGASSGVYSITAGIPNGTPVVTVTYRATYTSPLGNAYTIDKTFTVAKSNAGTNGTNGVDGTNGTDALLMSMSASSQVFQISKSNVVSPSSINFTAKRNNVTGANFTVTSGTATLTSIVGDNATLTYANLTTDSATIRVADNTNTYADTITVIKVREGVDSLSGILTNDSVTVPASSAGVVSSYSGATGSFIVYYGSANVTTSCTFSVQANPDSLTTSIVGSGASAGQYNVTSGMSSVTQSSVTYRATYTNAFGTVFTVDKIFSLSKSNTGSTGATGVTGAAARIAYGKFANGFVPSPTSSLTVSGDNLPTNGYWGTQIGSWQTTPFTLSTGESQFQTTGLFDTTANQTVWVVPYLSNLKVGNLAALTVNTGALTVSDTLSINTGAVSGTTMTGSGGQINSNGSFALGNSTGNINYNGTSMTMNGDWGAGSAWKLKQTTNNYLQIGGAGSATLALSRVDNNGHVALGIYDTNTSGLDTLYISSTAAGAATYSVNTNASGYAGLFNGRVRLLSTASPIGLNSDYGTTGQVLTSAGSSSTPTWGKTLAGGAATTDGSGNATIAVTMPNSNFGFSACATSGKIITVTSVTNTGGSNYDVVVQSQTSSTGAAAATVGFRWTAIG